ncbi:MAG TPA: hypothetical protein VLT13_09170 [Bacteroidota bacterium]|nr:hypothetical protein [Bacteroidota bacterium]
MEISTRWTERSWPTIRAPQRAIGERAAEILIRNIESTALLPTERVVLETEFIVRESTRALKTEAVPAHAI